MKLVTDLNERTYIPKSCRKGKGRTYTKRMRCMYVLDCINRFFR